MMTRLALTLVAALLAAAACSTSAVVGGLPAGPFTIGLITSLSGIDLPLGADARLGAQLAVDEVNAGGGVGGRQVRLVVGDDGSSAAGAAAAYAALGTAGLGGVIGPLNADAASSVVPLSLKRQTPLLSTAGADPPPMRPNLFFASPSATRSAERMLAYAKGASLSSVAVAHTAGDAFADASVSALHAGASRYGVKIAIDSPFDAGTVDFTPTIEAVRASGAKLLLVVGGGSGPPLLERAWKPSGLDIPILLSPASATTAFLRAVSDSGEGALLETTDSWLAPSLPAASAVHRQVDPMAAAFQRANGYYPSQSAFDGYAGARLLLRAIAVAGSIDPARVNAALAGLDLVTAAGTFHYSARDHLGLPASWLAIARIADGKLVPAA